MAREVILSRKIDGVLDGLTGLKEETNGILLYRRQDRYCPIEALFMTGVGVAGHVQAQPKRIEIVNKFLQRNTAYQFVKFHTHSEGTISRFGEHYATHFSERDIVGYNEQLMKDPDFIGMVATSKTKLLYAPDSPILRIAEGFPSEANQRIHRELGNIAHTMGYDLSMFGVKRKK